MSKFNRGDHVWYTGRGSFSRASRVDKIGVVESYDRIRGVAVKFDGDDFVEQGILPENLALLNGGRGNFVAEDVVSHPTHYTSHPSGVECITITEHMSFTLGNAIKYIWRAGLKDQDKSVEDLKKARFYLDREIALRKKG